MIGVLLLAAIRGSILLVMAWVATIVLRSKSAALRHSIWNFAIASQLALPIVALIMPQRPVSFGKLGDRAVRVTTAIGVTSTPMNRSVEGTPTQQNSPARVSAGQTSPSTAIAAAPLANDVDAILRFIALLWAVGATLMVMRFVIGTLLVARETSRARLPVDRVWILLAGRIQDEMDLRREAVLLRGAKGEVPYTWGIVSPVVCLPAGADQWSLDRVRIVLIPELA